MSRYFGFNAPFLRNRTASGLASPTLVLQRQADERLIRNDLLQLLLTSPGERVMRPDFGSGIRRFLFEPITTQTMSSLRRNIEQTVSKYERRVNLKEVRITQDETLVNIVLLGSFRLDRFEVDVGSRSDADLLVELNIPTTQVSQLT